MTNGQYIFLEGSTSLAIRKIQIKVITRFHLTPIRMVTMKEKGI